jgi:ppGpp synthetase/RelA/SpoT-type nucleotidyltranferase
MARERRKALGVERSETFSNSAVNRAGADLLRLRQSESVPGEKSVDEFSADDVARWYDIVDWWRAKHAQPLARIAGSLRYHVRKSQADIDGFVVVTQRLKRIPTIIDKLERQPGMKLARMADIGGVRARVPDLESLDRLMRRLQKTWRTIDKHHDYVADPQDSGYRGIHLHLKKDGVRLEVQLRTQLQDDWANMVERASRRSGVDYKSGKGSPAILKQFKLIADALACLDRGESVPDELMARIGQGRHNGD